MSLPIHVFVFSGNRLVRTLEVNRTLSEPFSMFRNKNICVFNDISVEVVMMFCEFIKNIGDVSWCVTFNDNRNIKFLPALLEFLHTRLTHEELQKPFVMRFRDKIIAKMFWYMNLNILNVEAVRCVTKKHVTFTDICWIKKDYVFEVPNEFTAFA